MGCPVVISDQVNIHREISEARAGIVTRCDARQLASALLKFLENEELRKQAGRNGKRLVEERYSQDKVARQMIEVYERAVRG